MNKFLEQIKKRSSQLFHRVQADFKKFFNELIHPPKLQKFAAKAPESKWSFYLGTVYLTLTNLFKGIFKILIFGLFLAIGLALGYANGIMQDQSVPTLAQMDKQINHSENSSTLYYAGNWKIADVKSDLYGEPVSADKITPLVKNAIIATEDENFYQHKGVLPKSLIRAVFSEVTGLGTSTGGSTLTQQLAKMQFLTDQTTWKRKVTEMFYARRIENHFSKDQIISSYLNVATFGKNNAGQNIVGIGEAAKGIFGKEISELTLPEAAFIAGLPQSPSFYTPYTSTGALKSNLKYGLERKNTVLFRMYRNHNISKQEYEEALKYDLTQDFLPATEVAEKEEQNNYLYNLVMSKSTELIADHLIEEDGEKVSEIKKDDETYAKYYNTADTLLRQKGYAVHTTINKDFYQIMSETAANATLGQTYVTSDFDDSQNKTVTVTEKAQNGAVMLDNATGKVLAFSGGVDFDSSQVNHAFNTYRSPGSSIKPYLVYAPAIEKQLISSKTALPDFPTNYGKYIPTDFDNAVENRFINADEALKMSYNLPVVSLYNQLKDDPAIPQYMKKLGFEIGSSEYKQLGLSLGGTSNGFSVEQNAAAFATFYNEGNRVEPYFISKITDPSGKTIYKHKTKKTKVYKKSTSYIMKEMLHEVVTSGTASALSSSVDFDTSKLIGKTGTSNDFRDIWFNGSTPGVTISSWMGYDNFYGHSYNLAENASSTNLELWSDMVNQLYIANPKVFKLDQDTPKPSGVYENTVLKLTGTKPGQVDYNGQTVYLSGSTTTSLSLSPEAPAAKAEFSVGANASDYKLFYNYLAGKSTNYGTKLYYTGETVSDTTDLKSLFGENPNGSSTNSSNYYGNNTNTNNNESQYYEVQGNDQEQQTTGTGSGSNTSYGTNSTTNNNAGVSSSTQTPTTGGSTNDTGNNVTETPSTGDNTNTGGNATETNPGTGTNTGGTNSGAATGTGTQN